MKKLFVNDLRTVDMVYAASEVSNFEIVRNYAEFIDYIRSNGLPDFISFDNDLGLDADDEVAPDGYACAKWLVYESGLDLKNLEFKVPFCKSSRSRANSRSINKLHQTP